MRDHPGRPFWHLRRPPDLVQAEIDEELDVHLDLRARELIAQGLPADQARREAIRRFGDLEGTRRYCRRQDHRKEQHVQRGLMVQDLGQDVRICLRALRRVPVFALTIVLTVGLGIGATTAMFAAINATMLRPLPYANPDRLVRIYTDAPPNRFRFSVADYLALQEQQTRFEQVAGYTDREMSFADGTSAERLRAKVVSWSYFELLGIRPALGRAFVEADGRPGGAPVAIVSHTFWEGRLGRRQGVTGTTLRLDGADYTLVGVLPPAVGPLERRRDVFVAAQWDVPPRRGPFFITAIGRLPVDGDRGAAEAELRAINRRIFPLWQASYQDERATWSVMDLKTHVIGDVATIAGLALAAVLLVWVIACVNASNLLIARTAGRRRELAVRAALGASRARVVRYVLAESAILATGAALVGGALAWAGIRAIRTFGAGYLPRTDEVALDGPALWMLAAATALSGLLFGLMPASSGTSGSIDDALRSVGRSSTGNLGVRRLRRALVGAQFAVATPLLVGAALLAVSLNELSRVDLGFDTRNVLTAAVLLPATHYRDQGRITAFWDEFDRRVAAVPGIAGVAYADSRPPDEAHNWNNFDLEDAPTAAGQSQPVTPWVSVSPGYFPLLGLTRLDGRLFDDQDGLDDRPPIVIVDRAWASRFFPGQPVVGRRLRGGGCTTCPWTTIVGVVSDVRYAGLDAPAEGTVYWPVAARRDHPMDGLSARFRYIVLRTTAEPATLVPVLRQVLRELDPGLPLSDVSTVDDLVAESLQLPRWLSLLTSAFAAIALVLSLVGVYGVMTHYVHQHAKDISIRMALGGSPSDVIRLMVGQGMQVVAGGVIVGLLAALGLTRLMSSLLFGVAAADAATFGSVAALLLATACAACLMPARRAIGLEPATVLRRE